MLTTIKGAIPKIQKCWNTTATIRPHTVAIVVGAPLGGLVADLAGVRAALWLGIGGLTVVAVGLAASPFRRASYAEALQPARR